MQSRSDYNLVTALVGLDVSSVANFQQISVSYFKVLVTSASQRVNYFKYFNWKQ